MAQYKSKFIDIDPYTCTQEELANALSMLHNLSGYYESKQLAVKLFINSVYGATASKYFVGHNTAVAESITLQGQDLNHYSENCVNKYFRGIFQSREHYDRVIYVPLFEWMEKWDIADTDAFYAKDANKNWVLVNLPIDKDIIVGGDFDKSVKDMLKKVFVKTTFGAHLGITYEQAAAVDINKGRVTDQLPLDYWAKRAKNPYNPKENPFAYMRKNSYLEDDPTTSMTIAGDTDSLIGSSKIFLDKGHTSIEDAFTKCKYENHDIVLKLPNGQEIVPVKGHTTKAFDPAAPLLPLDRPIKYIMRHKVSKGKFKIKSKSGKEVIVTEDHSCMVIRDNKLIDIKAKDINPKTDKLVEVINYNPDNVYE